MTYFTEMLAYDCRLMNTAAARGGALTLRQWFIDSDECLSPQAAVLSPHSTIKIATAIVGADSHYHATVSAGLAAVDLLKKRVDAGALSLNKKEAGWLCRIENELQSLPDDETSLLAEMKETHAGVFDPASYGLA